VTSGCPILEKNEYIISHLYYSICKKLGLETAEDWYSHTSKVVFEMKM